MERWVRTSTFEFIHNLEGEIMTFDRIVSTEKKDLVWISLYGCIDRMHHIDWIWDTMHLPKNGVISSFHRSERQTMVALQLSSRCFNFFRDLSFQAMRQCLHYGCEDDLHRVDGRVLQGGVSSKRNNRMQHEDEQPSRHCTDWLILQPVFCMVVRLKFGKV